MTETDSIFGADGLRAFATSVIDARLLDGLSEKDADTVTMLLVLDFSRGPTHMAWRVRDWLNPDGNSVGREDDNTYAVAAVLALSLSLVLSAFAVPEFENASRVARMFEIPADELKRLAAIDRCGACDRDGWLWGAGEDGDPIRCDHQTD